jgi:magnesium-transporting ATPase (P-type)
MPFCVSAMMTSRCNTVQEYRADEAAEHLKVSVALKEQVLRDGQEVTVLGQDLVPGDVVLFSAGAWSQRTDVSSRPGTFSSTRHC